MFLTGFKRFFKKQFNSVEIRFINYLVDCLPCVLIKFIKFFNIYIHCHNIPRCPVGVTAISSTRNWRFRTNTCFCINIFRLTTGFLKNSSASTGSSIFSLNLSFGFVLSWRSLTDSFYCLSLLASDTTSSSIVTGYIEASYGTFSNFQIVQYLYKLTFLIKPTTTNYS